MGRGETDLDALLAPAPARPLLSSDPWGLTPQELQTAESAGYTSPQMRLLKQGLEDLQERDAQWAEDLRGRINNSLADKDQIPSHLCQALMGSGYLAEIVKDYEETCAKCKEQIRVGEKMVWEGEPLHPECSQATEEELSTASPQGAFWWLHARYEG